MVLCEKNHKDVVLDFFKSKKEIIFSLKSGMTLKINDVYLSAELNGRDVHIAKFSKAFVLTLEKLEGNGYKPNNASLQFIVAWKGEEDEEETPIVLVNISFSKNN